MPLLLPPSRYPRSPGVHLSGIIRCIATEQGILKPEWAEELSLVDIRTISDPVVIARICMGLAWEEWYIPTQLPQVVDHPGETLLDGVYMTKDGEELVTLILDGSARYALKLHEVKCTYKSIKTVMGPDWQRWIGRRFDTRRHTGIGPLTSQWMWLAQAKGYGKQAGTGLVDLHALYACGDYSWPMRPMAYVHHIEFTQDEMDLNWDLMVGYRDSFRGAMA